MSGKIKLSDEELKNVHGGETHAERTCKYLPSTHGKFIDTYEAASYTYQKVYVVRDGDREDFYWGILLDSYEDLRLIGTERKHKVLVEGCNDYWLCDKDYIGKEHAFRGKKFSLYLYN